MVACNGDTNNKKANQIEITRLEPVIIEMEENQKISSYLMLFEMKCNIGFKKKEMITTGEVHQTTFKMQAREWEE